MANNKKIALKHLILTELQSRICIYPEQYIAQIARSLRVELSLNGSWVVLWEVDAKILSLEIKKNELTLYSRADLSNSLHSNALNNDVTIKIITDKILSQSPNYQSRTLVHNRSSFDKRWFLSFYDLAFDLLALIVVYFIGLNFATILSSFFVILFARFNLDRNGRFYLLPLLPYLYDWDIFGAIPYLLYLCAYFGLTKSIRVHVWYLLLTGVAILSTYALFFASSRLYELEIYIYIIFISLMLLNIYYFLTRGSITHSPILYWLFLSPALIFYFQANPVMVAMYFLVTGMRYIFR